MRRLISLFTILTIAFVAAFAWETGDNIELYARTLNQRLWQATYSFTQAPTSNYSILIATGADYAWLEAEFKNATSAGNYGSFDVRIVKGETHANVFSNSLTYTNGYATGSQISGVYDLQSLCFPYSSKARPATVWFGAYANDSTSWTHLTNGGTVVQKFSFRADSKDYKLPSPIVLKASSVYFITISNTSTAGTNVTMNPVIQIQAKP